jgi:hypothetical protein
MDESGHMLDRLDFSMLNPSDGFDINMLLGAAEHTSDSPVSMPAAPKSIYADPIPHTSPYPRQDAQVATAYPSWNAHDFIMACTAANLNGSIMATAAPVSQGYPITPEEDTIQRRDYYHQYHSTVHEHYMHQEMGQSYWKHRDESSSAESNHGEA